MLTYEHFHNLATENMINGLAETPKEKFPIQLTVDQAIEKPEDITKPNILFAIKRAAQLSARKAWEEAGKLGIQYIQIEKDMKLSPTVKLKAKFPMPYYGSQLVQHVSEISSKSFAVGIALVLNDVFPEIPEEERDPEMEEYYYQILSYMGETAVTVLSEERFHVVAEGLKERLRKKVEG